MKSARNLRADRLSSAKAHIWGFRPTAKNKREMQPRKKTEKEEKQIDVNIPPLHFTFPHSSGVIIFESAEKNSINEVEVNLSQLFVGATYESKPLENLEFPTILEGGMQN